jgi:hypothetical protein
VRGRLLAAALVSLVLALAAFGCGGGSGDEEARDWAASVCSSIGDWRTDVEGTIQGLRDDPGAISAAAVREAADESLATTETLLDELRGSSPPDTDAGAQAKREIEQLLRSLEPRVERVRTAVEAVDVAGLLATLAAIGTEIEGATADGRDTLRQLRELDPADGIAKAFREEEACTALVE